MTPFLLSSGILFLTLTNICLIVLHGLNTALMFTPLIDRHTLAIFSDKPLTYGTHRVLFYKVDIANQTRPSTNENTEDNRENRTLCVPYVRGLSEKIANVCRSIKGVNMRAVFKPCRTIRQMLVRVKNRIPEDRRKGVIYEIPCQDCEKVYIGETGRTLKKRVSEHKQAVRKFNMNNGVATHVHNEDHRIDWEGAKVIGQQEFYWKRRVTEAIMIYQHNQQTMNLDCGLNLSKLWHASLDKPS